MNDEIELSQQAIDELLATANKELSIADTPLLESNELQEPAVTEPLSTTPEVVVQAVTLPAKDSQNVFLKLFKQNLTKKIAFAIFFSFALVIFIGALVGYKMADHNIISRTPIETIIQQGITFEEKNFVAYAGFGDKEIVNAFIDAGMPIDVIRTTDGWTPLMSASFYNKPEIVQLLLEKQATVNLQDIYGRTALTQATVMGAEHIVTMLLEAGADPNIQDRNGRTAILEAYYKKYARIAEILKNAGANPTPPPLKKVANPLEPSAKKDPIATQPVAPTANEETHLSVGKAGFIQIGMSIQDLKNKYPSLTLSEKFIDGTKKSIATIYLQNQATPSLQLELSSGTLKLVSTISIYDEKFSTDKQITSHSTVGDIRNQYTINDVKIIDNSLFLVVRSTKMLFELDLGKEPFPAEWLNTGNPNSIPAETKIKRIVIY